MKRKSDAKKSRALRLVLAQAVAHAAKDAMDITGRSINDLPEYFLSVSIARYVHQHFKTKTFSMEDTVKSMCEDLELDGRYISRPGNMDIVVRSQRKGDVKHVIELKRTYGLQGHKDDMLRLAEICWLAHGGHTLETNYMVMVSAATDTAVAGREETIRRYIDEEFKGRITLKRETVSFEDSLVSTRKGKTNQRPLKGEVWELRYTG